MMENNPIKKEDQEKLDYLQKLENDARGVNNINPNTESSTIATEKNDVEDEKVKGVKKLPSVVDGYRLLKKVDLPFSGKFYPNSWAFAYRCPTTEEIANFSTLVETDTPSIINTVESLIKKCYVIVDTDTNREVSTEEINDGERLFFFLKLREFYMKDLPIKYVVMNSSANEPVEISLLADMLIYNDVSESLLNCYDGRKFVLPLNNGKTIEFLMPTLNTSARIFRYVVNTYKETQKDDSQKSNKEKINEFDKKFLLIAPYLYVTGSEKISELKQKFIQIKKDEILFTAYLNLINALKLSNQEHITYEYMGIEEDALIKFPGGWKNMFINTEIFAIDF